MHGAYGHGDAGGRRDRREDMRSPWELLDEVREEFGARGGRGRGYGHGPGPRAGRGDIRTAILLLLDGEPMHGYQIIHEIEDRSEGTWRPSPGSIYPTLQLLADEGVVVVEESDGRKTYALTDSGHAEATAAKEKPAPWATPAAEDAGHAAALPRAGVKLGQAVAQVVSSGTPDQVERAVAVVDEARRRLYSILAEE